MQDRILRKDAFLLQSGQNKKRRAHARLSQKYLS